MVKLFAKIVIRKLKTMPEINLKLAQTFNPIVWLLENNVLNENGYPIEFKNHPFLIDPYLDNSEKIVVEKCAQIGFSTLAILKSFHLARFAGANIIHTFPSRNMSKDFVVPKVDPLINKNPIFKELITTDTVNLKGFGDRFIYYRGSYEQTEAISISASVLINDEFDRSNQKVLKTYRSRLDDAKRENPELGWEWQFSNPSIPGYGVDVWWEKSDKKHWFIKCPHCGYDWYLKWPDNIDFDRKIRICAKCRKPLSNDDLLNGRWVAKHLKRDISGYWISQLFVPWIPAAKIINDSEGDQEVFYNFTLGLPYVSKDTAMTREAILKCISPGHNPRTNVAMGVDNGVKKHYVVGNRYGIFEVGITDSWDEIEEIRNRYGALMVIDANPYPHMPQKLAEKYPGRVFIHYYQQDKNNLGIIRWEQSVVKSDRTKIIDHMIAEINSGDVTFNLTERQLEEYITHWLQMYRIISLTPQGILKPKWETIEGKPDHFAHATIFWRIALEQSLGQGGIVRPPGPTGSLNNCHPLVGVDSTVPALDLSKVVKRADQFKRRDTYGN